MKEKTKNISILIRNTGIFLFMFIINTIILTNVLFFIKMSISVFNMPIAFIITILEFYFINKKWLNIKQMLGCVLLGIILLIVIVILASKTYDLTWDGNTYHKTAIGSLKNGWNPVYEDVENFTQDKGNVINIDKNEKNMLWINHYPKASWIFAANIYYMTNNIESAKVLGCLMIFIAFSLFFTYLSKKMSNIKAFLVSLLIVFNPITIPQIFTYYIDGLLCISLFIIIYCLIVITLNNKNGTDNKLDTNRSNKEHFFILAYSLIFIINLKFTGLVYAGVFCGLFYLYWIYQNHKDGNLKEKFKNYTLFYIGIVVLSVIVVGYSPYVKNLLEKGHPFYPLFGKDKVDIITTNQPQYFKNRNVFQKFAITMFSEGSNIHDSYGNNNEKPHLKIPFTIVKDEIKEYDRPDTRISGFGPLYSGVFIISCILTFYMIYYFWRAKKFYVLVPFGLILFGMLFLILATDGSWWARYTPYLYLLPIFNIIFLLNFKGDNKKIISITLGIILFIMVAVNNGLIAYANIKDHFPKYEQIHDKYQKFIDNSNGKDLINIKLKTNGFEGIKYNINDAIGKKDIQYVDKIEGKSTYVQFFSYKTN